MPLGKMLHHEWLRDLGWGLISDCTEVDLENGTIVFTRPIYSGKAFQKKVFKKGKIFATLRPNNFELKENPVSIRSSYLSAGDQRY